MSLGSEERRKSMATKRKSRSDAELGLTGDPGIDEAIAKAEQVLTDEVLRMEAPDADPIALGPRVISPEDISRKLVERASAASDDWLKRVKAPRKHPIKEGIKAEGKYKSKMEEVLRGERRKHALEKVSDEDYLAGIDEAGSEAFRTGIERKSGKVGRRFAVLQPLYDLLAKAIDGLPVDTEAQREAKMRAARRGMIMVGKARRGEVAPAEIAAEVKKLAPGA
jgi:hypothetical protein